MNKNLLFAFVILTLSAIIGIYFRPLMIIDETRYVSVAWEMFDKHSFLVPLINSEPYHHKPPLLFWLIHLDWSLFGVNETSIRFIPLLFGLGTVLLSYKIYRTLWKEDEKGASYVALLLASVFIFAFYNSLVMFDVMLTFWVLVGILGIIYAANNQKRSGFILITLSIGFGILTKGPVILVHLLPLVLFAKVWKADIDKSFFIGFFFAFLGGAAIALAWAIPAGIAGGEEYRNAIFWGQSANRMVKSFAHQRPFWWYLPILPSLFFPWSIFKSVYSGANKQAIDNALKFLLVWLISVVVIFSLISGKQVHYILPEIPAFVLIAARILSLMNEEKKLQNITKYVGYFYIVFGVVLLIAYVIVHEKIHFHISLSHVLISTLLAVGYGLFLIRYRFKSFENILKAVAFSTVIAIFIVHFVMSDYLKAQNITSFAQKIAHLQQQHITVAQDKKYHDQFHFAGKLHEKVVVIPQKEKLEAFIKTDPEAVIITYRKYKQPYNNDVVLAKTAFKSKIAILVKAKDYDKL